jgi:hypothetical protein
MSIRQPGTGEYRKRPERFVVPGRLDGSRTEGFPRSALVLREPFRYQWCIRDMMGARHLSGVAPT